MRLYGLLFSNVSLLLLGCGQARTESRRLLESRGTVTILLDVMSEQLIVGLQALCFKSSLALLQDLQRLLVYLTRLSNSQCLLVSYLSLPGFLFHALLGQELLLVGNECLDVTWFIVFVAVRVLLVALGRLAACVTTSRLTAQDALVADLLLAIDSWSKAALFELFASLLFLRLADLGFLARPLLLNLALTLIDVDLGLVVLVVLVHDHVVSGDEQIGSFLVVELLDQFIVGVIEVFRTFHNVSSHVLQLLSVSDRRRSLQLAANLRWLDLSVILFGLLLDAVMDTRVLRCDA